MANNKAKNVKAPLESLVWALCDIDNPREMHRFLDEILTPAECSDLALRWQLMLLLLEGVPQRKIAERLGISLCKITRGAKILKTDGSVSKKHLSFRRQL